MSCHLSCVRVCVLFCVICLSMSNHLWNSRGDKARTETWNLELCLIGYFLHQWIMRVSALWQYIYSKDCFALKITCIIVFKHKLCTIFFLHFQWMNWRLQISKFYPNKTILANANCVCCLFLTSVDSSKWHGINVRLHQLKAKSYYHWLLFMLDAELHHVKHPDSCRTCTSCNYLIAKMCEGNSFLAF